MAHILVIDDDNAVFDTLRQILERAEHRVSNGYGKDLADLMRLDRAP